jgi:hypothetical protein
MSRALEPHDGITRRHAPELRSFHGPSGLNVPVCTFDGLVRTVDIEDPLVSQVFEAAFPGFKAGENHYRNVDIFGGRYRRYAGSSGSLDAGSYFSVARWSGHDDGSLAREIFAYTDPAETGLVMIDDMADPQDAASVSSKYNATIPSGEYLLLFVHEIERLMSEEWQELAKAQGPMPSLFRVPCSTRSMRRENVVDLRLPTVQAWFFETFSQEAWLNIHVPLPPAGSFLELLLVMLGQYRGGNVMTQAVGRELRLWGIDGLVYPSARCDCALVLEDGDVVDWYGWDLVDYEATRTRSTEEHDVLSAIGATVMGSAGDFEHGADFFGLPSGQMKIRVEAQGARRGTWQVRGLESLNGYRWIASLSPSQRQLLGLPADAGLVERRADGLHEVEQRFRSKYRALVETAGAQPIDIETMRALLGRLARVLDTVPGGGRAAANMDWVAGKLALGQALGGFVAIGVATGVLVEESKGYLRFDDPKTLEYFTTVGSGGAM